MEIMVSLEADHICILSRYLQTVPTEPIAETSEAYGERRFLGEVLWNLLHLTCRSMRCEVEDIHVTKDGYTQE